MRVLFLMCLCLLTACPATKNSTGFDSAQAPPAMAAGTGAAEEKPAAIEENPAEVKPGEVDYGCKTDGDCKIKDVGSCCGYRPACVNKDSATFPEQVKAQCGKQGMAGICGFPTISGCTCTNNKCEGVQTGVSEGQLQ